MTTKIFRSILLSSLAVLIACLTLVLGVLYNYFSDEQKKLLRSELSMAAAAMESSDKTYLEKLKSAEGRFTYIAPDGQVLFDTQADAASMENHGQREEVTSALATGHGESSRFSATLLEETLYYAMRLPNGNVLRISIDRMTVPALLLGMAQPLSAILLITLGLSYFLAGRMTKRIIAPLNALNLDQPLENQAYDEIAPLLTHIEQQHRKVRQQKEELTNRKNEFFTIIKNMDEGLVLLNQHRTILSMNPAAEAFFGTQSSFIGKDFIILERNHEINTVLENAVKTGTGETQISKNGKEFQFHATRIEENGEITGIVILIFDITEKVFAEQNRKEFTANVSHELKTPLHSIMASAELLENGVVKPEDTPRFIQHIRNEASRLLTLIQDTIRLSQLDEKAALPDPEPVDLLELTKKEIESLRPAAEEKNVTFSIEGSALIYTGVKQLLHEILYNLCDNAVKYNKNGGKVIVTLGTQKGKTMISVADTGIGIPEAQQAKVFERFYRVDKSHSKESGGTGLGLSIVKHAVQFMNGTISLKSRPDEGTVITVSL